MGNIAAFDIGGTFVKHGVISENGEVFFSKEYKTHAEKGGKWIIAAVFYLCEISCRMHEYMTGVYALSSIFIAYEWHISPATDNDPSGRRFLNILPPGGVIIISTSYASSSAMR